MTVPCPTPLDVFEIFYSRDGLGPIRKEVQLSHQVGRKQKIGAMRLLDMLRSVIVVVVA